MSTKLTRSEFLEKYGQIEVVFLKYYKFTFTYVSQLPDGGTITVGYGGESNQIYKHDVEVGEKMTVSCLDPYCGSVQRDGIDVENFYDINL